MISKEQNIIPNEDQIGILERAMKQLSSLLDNNCAIYRINITDTGISLLMVHRQYVGCNEYEEMELWIPMTWVEFLNGDMTKWLAETKLKLVE